MKIGKASLFWRSIAYVIDYVIFLFFYFILTSQLIVYINQNEDYVTIIQRHPYLLITLPIILLFSLKDTFGRSLGKKICGLNISSDLQSFKKTSFIRSYCRNIFTLTIPGIEFLVALLSKDSRTLGERITKTIVITENYNKVNSKLFNSKTSIIVTMILVILVIIALFLIKTNRHHISIDEYREKETHDMAINRLTKQLEENYDSKLIYDRAMHMALNDPSDIQQVRNIFKTAYQAMHYPYDDYYVKCIRDVISCEKIAKTYNFQEETKLLEGVADNFNVHYFKGVYCFMNDQNEAALQNFNSAYVDLKKISSDSLHIKYENLRSSFFVGDFTSSIPSLTSTEIDNKNKNEFLFREINTFLAMCYLIDKDYDNAINILENSEDITTKNPHELFLLHHLYNLIDMEKQSKSNLTKLKTQYPYYIKYTLMDNSNEIIDVFKKDKILSKLIEQMQNEYVRT